ncbi:uncharacterized protein LOC129226690 [Uloborus diversus]|uniref:uncharacterized protein LOC129226690 n=1 Tax=Uloborus diversus TaxID=327109 RepID=UPI00240A4910|nr:uncharacterized protein LOC129226690 [Uloborus diversus]
MKKKLKIVDSKEEVKPMTDVREKSNKKNDKKLNTVQAQNSTSSFKKKSTPPKAVDGNIENKKAKVHSLLKDGSEVLVNGCGYLSSRYFQEALCLIKESPQIYGFQECDIVCIKYAYATAFYSSGEYSDLLKSIEILQEIYQEHENVSFPIVYYGLAMAFLKLNRFKDSLRFAKMVQDFLNKGFRLKVYTWPGLTTPIPETKAEILKKYIKDLIEECENPPKPVAVCRLENCSQPHIYYSDPDFKGFICISCSEQCSLQYHVPCWRTMKTDLSLSDKDFLSKNCLTPDCSGSIAEVKNIDKQGNIGKVFAISESKKPQKQKKSKLEKKSDAKEEKRKRRRHSSSICESISSASEAPSHEDLNPSNSSSKLSQNETETEVSSSAHVEDLDNPEAVSVSSRSLSEERTNNKTWKMSCAATEKNSDLPQISPSAVRNVKTTLTTTTNEPRVEIAGCATEVSSNSLTQQSTFYTDADPFHGAKGNAPPDNSKNAEIMITKSRPVSKFKGKTLKCDAAETSNKMNSYVPNEIHSRVPNVVYSRVPNEADSIVPNATNSRVQYSDAFWSTHEAEDFPPLPASENSSHYAVECQSLNKDVSTPPDYLEEVLEKNIFTYLEDFLSFHGPLKIDDPILIEALSEFPTQANVLIADCGGISEFLKKNIHFAVVGESYVCVVKDIGSAYNLVSRRSLAQESDCHDLLNTVCDFSNGTAVKNSNFPTYLNPDAMEYQPFYPTGTKCGDYAQNDVSRKASEHDSESLMSVISRLRQPLCVDEDNVVMNSSCDNVSTLDAQSLNSDISRTAQVATRPHPKKVVTTKCANASAIVSDVDGVAEEEVVLNGTLGEGSISDEVVKEGISSEIVKERISTGTAQKVLSDETVERSIPKETVLGRIFSNSVEDGISEGKVEENIYDKTVHVKNLEETVMERNLEKTTRERNLKERVQKKGLREVVQGILEEEKNFEGAVQERISNETMQLGISDGTVLKISQKLTNEAISNAAIKDSALRTALSETLNTALVRALLRASDEENDIQNEKMGNVCIGAMENKAPCKSMKVSENSFQNQILVKENQNCGHRIPETVAKASQTENAQQGTMVSKGTMKTDESLDRMKEIIGLLQDKERLASEELHKKNVENEKLRNEVESLQMSLNKANEVNAIAKKEIEKVHLDLQELEKNHIDIKNWQDNMTKSLLESREDSKSLHETLLKTEERCKKVSVESEEKCKKLAEKLAESEEKCKRTNEKLQLLEKKEISLRTESQAAFEHLNELVASLTNEKFESIKRAVKAELSVLQLKKAEVLNRIDLKIAEANQKVKELKEGMSLIPLDPVNTKNIEALISQIDNQYVKDLCAIRDDYGAKIDKHIKEVESGTPLEKLKIDEVENLPEIPQVTVPSPIFNPTATYTAANVSVDPAYLKMASAFAPVTMPPTLLPIGATNSIASVPIAPNVPTNIAAAVPEAAAPAPTLKKLPPGISSSYVNLPKSIPSRSLASEAVHELNSLVQLSETSKSESTKPKIISTDSLSSSSSAEGKAAAKFSDSSLELGYSIKGNSAGKGSSVPQGKNSYEKLLIRLVEKFPNYTQVQLMSYIREFREKRQGKLSGLTLDAIVTQVGALIQSKQSAAKIESSKVPEVVPKFRAVQNKVSGKKLITDLKAREPPVEVPPIKKGNPWGSGAGESSKKWSGDTLEECAICCEEFANENAAYKVDCGHCFHLECIREWLNKKSDCPICRVHLLLPEDYPSLS